VLNLSYNTYSSMHPHQLHMADPAHVRFAVVPVIS
jgi:hypothetical protein